MHGDTPGHDDRAVSLLRSPLILTPLILTPLILTPLILTPLILTPMAATPYLLRVDRSLPSASTADWH
jgi:hypothetical protein